MNPQDIEFVRDVLDDILEARRYEGWRVVKLDFHFPTTSFMATFQFTDGKKTTIEIHKETVSNVLRDNSIANLWEIKKLVRKALLREDEAKGV